VNDTALDFGNWNPGVALQAAVDKAMAEYVEPEPVEAGQVVAVRCRSKSEVKEVADALTSLGFEVKKLKHEGERFVWISDLRGTDPDDAIFELGWYGDRIEVGTIPDPRTSIK
jgi:hypothetical protein